MGIWDTFIRVWQVRTSVRVQRGIENYLVEQKRINELNANIPIILNELEKKNESWENEYKRIKKTMKTNEYNKPIIAMMAALLWGFILYSCVPFYYKIYLKSSTLIQTNNNPNLENCKGLGDANCYNKLIDHVNNISGLEVSSSVFIGDGKFNTTILKNNPSGSGIAAITTTITVDCNCQIVNTGGTTIQ